MRKIIVEGQIADSADSKMLDWYGIKNFSPEKLRAELAEAKGDDVELQINSPGGSVWAASAMYAALKEYSGNVTGTITGLAASAATILLCGCDVVAAWPTVQLMIHNPSTVAAGDHREMDSAKQMLDTAGAGMIAAYTAKTGRTAEELQNWMEKETWMSATDALELGFVDEIINVRQLQPLAAGFGQLDLDKLRESYLQAAALEKEETADTEPWQSRASARLHIERVRY